MRRRIGALVALVSVTVGLTTLPARPADAVSSAFLSWPEGRSFQVFGADQAVTIDIGAITFTRGCRPGFDDFFHPFANVYVVPGGTVESGALLRSAANEAGLAAVVEGVGQGNTFIEETIGFTKPTGGLSSGRYDVVFDECQDGRYDPPTDLLIRAAFEVVIPTKEIPFASAAILAVKQSADSERVKWQAYLETAKSAFIAIQTVDALQSLTEVAKKYATLAYNEEKISPWIAFVTKHYASGGQQAPKATGLLKTFRDGALQEVINRIAHYVALAADPPDPAYAQHTTVRQTETFMSPTPDPLLDRMATVANFGRVESALVESLRIAIERHDGAAAAGNGQWTLNHARDVAMYSQLLRSQLADTSGALADLSKALSADERSLDETVAALQDINDRVVAIGYVPLEEAVAGNLGLTPTDMQSFRTQMGTEAIAGFTKSGMRSIITDLIAEHSSLSTNLALLAESALNIESLLSSDTTVPRQSPRADAGGPYSGSSAAEIQFDGSASSSPTALTQYDWDLDGSGTFGANGRLVSRSYPRGYIGLVGLRVKNLATLTDVSYTRVNAPNTTAPPSLLVTPVAGTHLQLERGEASEFTATVSQSDGHPVDISWAVDGETVAGGPSFTFDTGPTTVGIHSLEAIARDTDETGQETAFQWSIAVSLPKDTPAPPTILSTAQPAANSDGWNNSNVTVQWTVFELRSGIRESTGCATDIVSIETTGREIACTAISNSGLQQAGRVVVKLDKTAPSTRGTVSRPVNGSVTVALTASDPEGGSGVKRIQYVTAGAQATTGVLEGGSGSLSISAQGKSHVVYYATDTAGNREPAKVLAIDNQTILEDYIIDPAYSLSVFASGFASYCCGGPAGQGPIGVAFDATGSLYVTDVFDGHLYKFGPSGGIANSTTRVSTASLGGDAKALTFDKSGRLYLSRPSSSAGDLVEISPTTGARIRTVATGLVGSLGLATDPLSGDLFVGHSSQGVVKRISNFSTGRGTVTTYAATGSVDGLTFGPDGTLYAALGASGGQVARITGTNSPTPGVMTVLASVPAIDGIAVRAAVGPGLSPVLVGNGVNGKITEIDTATSPATVRDLISNGTRGDFVAVGPDGCLYATQSTTVVKVSNRDGSCSLVPEGVVPRLSLGPLLSAIDVGANHSFAAAFANIAVPTGTPITFTVSGANARVFSSTSDESGRAYGAYVGTNQGLDRITATATVAGKTIASNLAEAVWTSPDQDSVPPTTTATQAPTPNVFGWNSSSVLISLEAVDNAGGVGIKELNYSLRGGQNEDVVVAADRAAVSITTAGLSTLTYFAIDRAGNAEAPRSLTLRVDKRAPATTARSIPAANRSGWNSGPVDLRLGATDDPDGSGIASLAYRLTGSQTGDFTAGAFASVLIAAEGTTTVTYQATDRAGNVEVPVEFVVRVDTRQPSVTSDPLPAPNSAGWNKGGVDVSLAASDEQDGSGVESLRYRFDGAQTADSTTLGEAAVARIAAEGTTTLTYTASDRAGNVTYPQSHTIRIDETVPSTYALLSAPPDEAGVYDSPVTIILKALDRTGSGVSSIQSTAEGAQAGGATTPGDRVELLVSAVGVTTITYYAKDRAGNLEQPQSLVITIAPPAVVSVAVAPRGTTISPGQTQQFVATATYTDESTANVTSSANWSSSDPSVATISPSGLATARTGGSTTIRAAVGSSSDSTLLTVNTPPSGDVKGPYSGNEGAAVSIAGTASDADGDALTTTWTVTPLSGTDTGAACSIANPSAVSTTVTCNDDGTYALTLAVSDGNAPVAVATTALTVANVSPVLTLTTPENGALYHVGATVGIAGSVTDPGSNDTRTCLVNWDDGGVSTNGTVANGSCTAAKSFAAAGVYTVSMTVTDDDGGRDAKSVMIVIYDPSAGFVTGGGSITSSPGAYAADPTLAGKATFGFVSKYWKDATAPTGETEFQFQVAGFNFHSSTYQWLVVSGPKAQYKGTGTVNGVEGYSFLLTATDGQVPGGGGADKFRIKIWIRATGATVYDNVMGTSTDIDAANPPLISTGSIVIHK